MYTSYIPTCKFDDMPCSLFLTRQNYSSFGRLICNGKSVITVGFYVVRYCSFCKLNCKAHIKRKLHSLLLVLLFWWFNLNQFWLKFSTIFLIKFNSNLIFLLTLYFYCNKILNENDDDSYLF